MGDGSKDTILLVDDEPSIAELISDFCSELGFSVHTLTDSKDAFQAAKTLKPSLITLDLQMPHVDGFQLLKNLKADPDTCHIPVIIVSIIAGDAERRGLLSAAQAILTKPINLKRLQDKVTQYVQEKPADRP